MLRRGQLRERLRTHPMDFQGLALPELQKPTLERGV
jgi:hypothetical protein